MTLLILPSTKDSEGSDKIVEKNDRERRGQSIKKKEKNRLTIILEGYRQTSTFGGIFYYKK